MNPISFKFFREFFKGQIMSKVPQLAWASVILLLQAFLPVLTWAFMCVGTENTVIEYCLRQKCYWKTARIASPPLIQVTYVSVWWLNVRTVLRFPFLDRKHVKRLLSYLSVKQKGVKRNFWFPCRKFSRSKRSKYKIHLNWILLTNLKVGNLKFAMLVSVLGTRTEQNQQNWLLAVVLAVSLS